MEAFPHAFASWLVFAIYSNVDVFFAGIFFSAEHLSVIAMTVPVLSICEGLLEVLCTGARVQICYCMGCGKRNEASGVYTLSLLSTTFFSLLFIAFSMSFFA